MSPLIDYVWVGEVSDNFDACERGDRALVVDVELARAQHAQYVQALERCGLEVRQLETRADCPDAVFVEDVAVVLDRHHAVITRPGAPSRRSEVDSIAAVLAPDTQLYRMTAPAQLDGGDVLRVADRLFIGISTRANQAGADFVTAAARHADVQTTLVDVPQGLHLKSAATVADACTMLYDPSVGLDLEPFHNAGLECIAAPEPSGANVLALGSGNVLVSAAAPRTTELLEARGMHVTSLELSEFHKADGALTCCSIRVPSENGWCT